MYDGSILSFPPSTLLEDPYATHRAGTGIIAWSYIRSEENVSQHETADSDKKEGMEAYLNVGTPFQRKFKISDTEDEAMKEVEWRDKEPYMTPMKKRKKFNTGKGVQSPVMPK